MSIEIQADFIKGVGNGKIAITEPEKFAKLSGQLLDLIKLQITKYQDKSKLKLLIEDHKIILLFDEQDPILTNLGEDSIEDTLVKGLAITFEKVKKYHELIVNSKITEAKSLDQVHKSALSKAANILSKIETADVELMSSGNVVVEIPQLPKIDIEGETYKSMSLFACRITKPELVTQMDAVFISYINDKKAEATLNIAKDDEQFVREMAFNGKKVDIDFEYLVRIQKSNKYKGSLTSIKESDVINSNIELVLDP